jgi:hypothetical protein
VEQQCNNQTAATSFRRFFLRRLTRREMRCATALARPQTG